MTKSNQYTQSANVGALVQALDAEPALPGRRRAAPSGGSVLREAKSVGAYVSAA
jgi:hypothetical protein